MRLCLVDNMPRVNDVAAGRQSNDWLARLQSVLGRFRS
jgi:hypothetical protein